jgi:hypothetical protein
MLKVMAVASLALIATLLSSGVEASQGRGRGRGGGPPDPGGQPPAATAPEFHPGAAGTALALIIGSGLVLYERRRRKRRTE